jgi:prophage antirepressor-like protein
MTSIITFQNQELEIIDRDGERWLTAAEIAKAVPSLHSRSSGVRGKGQGRRTGHSGLRDTLRDAAVAKRPVAAIT